MRKHITAVSLLVAAIALVLAGPAKCGENPWAKGAVHIMPHSARTCTEGFPVISGCEDIVTTLTDTDVDVFPVFFSLGEYKEFVYSLVWTSGSSCTFTSCTDYFIGSVVWSGDGIVQGWDVCQTADPVVTGWGRLQGEGWVHLWMHFELEIGGVYDCEGQMDPVCYAYFSAFGGQEIGDDPCEPVDPSGAAASTWGGIKAMLR
jgi:hypothetical protein